MRAESSFAAQLRWWRRRRGVDPVLAMHFRKGDISLELFTTIATLGTPRDVTLEELRIESFFPVDPDTGAAFRAWSAG